MNTFYVLAYFTESLTSPLYNDTKYLPIGSGTFNQLVNTYNLQPTETTGTPFITQSDKEKMAIT